MKLSCRIYTATRRIVPSAFGSRHSRDSRVGGGLAHFSALTVCRQGQTLSENMGRSPSLHRTVNARFNEGPRSHGESERPRYPPLARVEPLTTGAIRTIVIGGVRGLSAICRPATTSHLQSHERQFLDFLQRFVTKGDPRPGESPWLASFTTNTIFTTQ
jgi:hypothetical protein